MPDIEIHPVRPAYEAQIRALSAATQKVHEARLPHIFYDGGAHQRQLLDIVFDAEVPDNIRAFMALQGDVLAGYVLVIPDQAEDADQPTNALIADICVVEEFRKQGIAAALLAHCAGEKDRLGWESLHAQVWQGNEASHQLFSASGYTAERTDYRLGQPSPPRVPPDTSAQSRWLVPLGLLLIAGLIAYLFQ